MRRGAVDKAKYPTRPRATASTGRSTHAAASDARPRSRDSRVNHTPRSATKDKIHSMSCTCTAEGTTAGVMGSFGTHPKSRQGRTALGRTVTRIIGAHAHARAQRGAMTRQRGGGVCVCTCACACVCVMSVPCERASTSETMAMLLGEGHMIRLLLSIPQQ